MRTANFPRTEPRSRSRRSFSALRFLLCLLVVAAAGSVAAPRAGAQEWLPLAEVETLGTGTAGAVGVPVLELSGLVAVDQPGAALQLTNGAPRALAQVVLSLAAGPTPLPTYGAQLWPAAPHTRWLTALDPDGASPVLASGPAPTPAVLTGLDIFAQGLVLDAGARGGAAFTAGLRMRVGTGSSAARLFLEDASFVEGGLSSAKRLLVVGDLDGNGRQDLVVARDSSPVSGSIRVFRQLTDGSLALPLVSLVPGKVTDLDVADVDGDGQLDVMALTPAAAGGALQLLPGLGNGALGDPQVLPAPASVIEFALGDVTGDGLPDVVAAGWTTEMVAVLPGLSGGGFGEPMLQSVPAAASASDLHVTDLNGDALADVLLVTPEFTGSGSAPLLRVLRALGGGSFAPVENHELFGGGHNLFVAVGDVNGDGAPDVARSEEYSNPFGGLTGLSVGVFLNDGSGAFPVSGASSAFLPLYPLDGLAIINLNGVGSGKVVLAREVSMIPSESVTLEYTGGPELGPPQPLGFPVTLVVPADMDGDGAQDLALLVMPKGPAQVRWVRGAGDGTLVLPPRLADFKANRVVACDFDGDGDTDLAGRVLELQLGWRVAIVRGDGNGSFGAAALVPIGESVAFLAAGDLDGDGAPDLVASLENDEAIAVASGLGDGTFAPPVFHPATNPSAVQVGDVTRDGRLDVVVAQETAGLLVYPTLPSGQLGAPTLTPWSGQGKLARLALADIDGDGDLDAVVQASKLTLFRGTGSAAFEPGVSFPLIGSAVDSALTLGDLDSDGDFDLAGVSHSGPMTWWLNDGTGAFTAGGDFYWLSAPGPISEVTIADVNGDGAADIVGSGVRLGHGDGTLAPYQAGAVTGACADFDGDGDLDFFSDGRVYLNALQ